MSHYAELNNSNQVVNVKTGPDESTFNGESWYLLKFGTVHKRTSYNTYGGIHYDPETREPSADQSKAFRKNYAGIGYTYDEFRDAFIPPKLYPSWILNEESCLWEPPVAYPDDGKMYNWNEETQTWNEIVIE